LDHPDGHTSAWAETFMGLALLSMGKAMQARQDTMTHKALTPVDLNEGFVVAIEIASKPGEEEAVANGLTALIEPTMAEPGVKVFLPYRSPTDRTEFFVFELYRNEEAWAEHQRTDHFKAFIDEILPRIARRKRVPFVPYARIESST
jgi:quinol monooxygenase YgiN